MALNISSHLELQKLGYLFYIVNPSEHFHERTEDVRHYFNEIAVISSIAIGVEMLVNLLRKNSCYFHEIITDHGHAMFTELMKIPTKGSALWTYSWIYANYRLFTLPWDSIWVWILGFLSADFFYYWIHRLTHQVNIFWAVHEVHHSSESIKLSSSYRNHILYYVLFWVMFNPFALFIPPTINLVHYELAFIYQLWLHTEQIGKLPRIFEYIFNTPNHHRVHHARNRKYIDKNYAAVLIIWDRLFGTFEEEDPDDMPVYGTTTQIRSFNPFVMQTQSLVSVWKKFWRYEKIGDRISSLIKGPGWSPGKPWLGNLEDVPHPPPSFPDKGPFLPLWIEVYAVIHYFIYTSIYMIFVLCPWAFTGNSIFVFSSFIIVSSITVGCFQDNSRFAVPMEYIRILLFFAVDATLLNQTKFDSSGTIAYIYLVKITFIFSLLMWIALAAKTGVKKYANWQNWWKTKNC